MTHTCHTARALRRRCSRAIGLVVLLLANHPAASVGARMQEPPADPSARAEARAITNGQPDFTADITMWNEETGVPPVRVGRLMRNGSRYRFEPRAELFGQGRTKAGAYAFGDIVWLYSVDSSSKDLPFITLLPAERKYARLRDGAFGLSFFALLIAPYPYLLSFEESEIIRIVDGGEASVNGHSCRVVKIVGRMSETTLYVARELKGLVIKGVLRSDCCATFNPDGLAFELDNIELGSHAASFVPPANYREVASIEIDLESAHEPNDDGAPESGADRDGESPPQNAPPRCETIFGHFVTCSVEFEIVSP